MSDLHAADRGCPHILLIVMILGCIHIHTAGVNYSQQNNLIGPMAAGMPDARAQIIVIINMSQLLEIF